MRILFVSTYPHLPDIIGGLQTTTHDLCRALALMGAEAAVLCGLNEHRTAGADLIPQRDETLGYSVFRVADPGEALAMVAAHFDPTAIVVQSGTALVPMVVRALETGRPTAIYLHNVETHQVGGILQPDPALLYLANSAFTAARWKALYGLDCAVIPPLVEADDYRVAETGDQVLFVNPTPIKGVEILFGLAAACPQFRFLVAESWTLDPRWRTLCRRRAEALGNIDWVPPTRDMRALYRRARCLLMPSLWEEAFGRTVIEAQVNGIPVLASNRGALPDTVGAGGLLVDPHAPIGVWAEALTRIMGEDHAALSQAAAEKAFLETAANSVTVGDLLSLLARHALR